MTALMQLLQSKYDLLMPRERLLVLLLMVAIPAWAGLELILLPQLEARGKLHQQLKTASSSLILLEAQIQALKSGKPSEHHLSLMRQRDQKEAELARIKDVIGDSISQMIPPQAMPKAIQEVLTHDAGLKLISIENLPATTVALHPATPAVSATSSSPGDIIAPEATAPEQVGPALFEHRFVVTLEGSYPDTLAYFNHLSKLPWHLQWESLSYQVTEYPNARIVFTVRTLSLSREWIGV